MADSQTLSASRESRVYLAYSTHSLAQSLVQAGGGPVCQGFLNVAGLTACTWLFPRAGGLSEGHVPIAPAVLWSLKTPHHTGTAPLSVLLMPH